jgi:hypothetical protein
MQPLIISCIQFHKYLLMDVVTVVADYCYYEQK